MDGVRQIAGQPNIYYDAPLCYRLSRFVNLKKKKPKYHVTEENLLLMTFVAHSCSTAISKILFAPVNRTKILLQLQPLLVSSPYGFKQYNRVTDLLYNVYKLQGFRSFWWGMVPHTWNSFQSIAIRLMIHQKVRLMTYSFNTVKNSSEQTHHTLSLYWRKVQIFFISTTTALLFSYPLDVLYTRMSADNGLPWNQAKRTYKSVIFSLLQTTIYLGVAGLYRGFLLCVATNIPFICIAQALHMYFETLIFSRIRSKSVNHFFDNFSGNNTDSAGSQKTHYNIHKSDDRKLVYYPSSNGEDRVNTITESVPLNFFPWNYVVGILAGLLAQTLTYPFDTLRRRYQYDGSNPWTSPPFTRKYADYNDCFRKSVRLGIPNLYKGCGINLLKAVPECFVLCGFYHLIKSKFVF